MRNPCLGKEDGYTYLLGECNKEYAVCFDDKAHFFTCQQEGYVFDGSVPACRPRNHVSGTPIG